jgi:putative MATE family efflux protein
MVGMLRCVEVVKISLIIACITLVVNTSLDYILIYGKLGFPAMGVRGAAVATVIARACELLFVLFYVFRMDKRLRLKVRDLFIVERQLYADFFRYGLPILFGDLQWGLVGTFKATIVGRLGPIMVAANSMTEVVLSLGTVFTGGLANAATVIIGKTVGVGDYKKTREYSNTIQLLFLGVGLVMMSLVFALRWLPLSLYQVSGQTRDLAMIMLAIGAVTMVGTTYHAACFTGINRGAGDAKFVFKVDMICGWLIVLPSMYLMAFVLPGWLQGHWPASAITAFVMAWQLPLVFLCSRIDQCFKWLIALLRLRGDKWIRNVTRA